MESTEIRYPHYADVSKINFGKGDLKGFQNKDGIVTHVVHKIIVYEPGKMGKAYYYIGFPSSYSPQPSGKFSVNILSKQEAIAHYKLPENLPAKESVLGSFFGPFNSETANILSKIAIIDPLKGNYETERRALDEELMGALRHNPPTSSKKIEPTVA